MRTLHICCILAFTFVCAAFPQCASAQFVATDDIWYDNNTKIVHVTAFTSAPYGYYADVAAEVNTPYAWLHSDIEQNGWAEIDYSLDVADYGFGNYTLKADHSAYANYTDYGSWDPWWYAPGYYFDYYYQSSYSYPGYSSLCDDPYYGFSSGGASAECPQYLSGGTVWLGSSTKSVTAQGPYQVEPIGEVLNTAADCSNFGGGGGWMRSVTNQLQYRGGNPYAVPNLLVADTMYVGLNQLNTPPPRTGSYPTTGDGSFPDIYYACSTACPNSTGETDALQYFTVGNGIGVLPHVDSIVYKCTSISIDGNTHF